LVKNQEVAASFKSSCREYDQVGRLGGDEFVFVLPEVTKDLVAEMQKRLARAVKEASRTICGETIVSLSVGSALFPADGRSGEELLSEAGRSMYQAKDNTIRSSNRCPRLGEGQFSSFPLPGPALSSTSPQESHSCRVLLPNPRLSGIL